MIAFTEVKCPRLLTGKPKPGWRLHSQLIFSPKDIKQHVPRKQAARVGFFDTGAFFRMMCKIAHAVSFAYPPPEGHVRLLQDVIIRNADPLWYAVSGNFNFENASVGHQIGFGILESNGCIYGAVYIRMYSNLKISQTYEVLTTEKAR